MYWHKTPKWLQWIYSGLEWHGPRDRKVLYLTFDDGPIPDETPFILDTLASYGVKATFFCVGDNIRKHPALFREVVAAGHSTGNHTMHHVKGWGMETTKYLEDVRECDEWLKKEGGTPGLFRPPYGKATRGQLRTLKSHRVIMWDVLSGDFDTSLSPGRCLDKTLRATRNGSIVLFHENVKAHDRVRYALPAYIETMQEQGFEFDAL